MSAVIWNKTITLIRTAFCCAKREDTDRSITSAIRIQKI